MSSRIRIVRHRYIVLLVLLLWKQTGFCQSSRDTIKKKFTIGEVIGLTKLQNKKIQAAIMEESASQSDLHDAQKAKLPQVSLSAEYQRYSKLVLYNDFIYHSRSVNVFPSSNAALINSTSTFNLYSGGKLKADVLERKLELLLSKTETLDLKGSLSLKAADLYLELVALQVEECLTKDQLSRAELRLKNINSLFQNQKITRSDLLRAEVNLSDVKLSLEETHNNIIINRQKLNVLLNLPESTQILTADSTQILNEAGTALDTLSMTGTEESYAVRKAQAEIQLEQARGQKIKSNKLPSLGLFGTYYLAYPNTLPFPHVDQAYSLGYIGIGIQYNLSALYQNKYKLNASRTRTAELQLKKEAISDDVAQEQKALIIKYNESLNRIKVNQQSIEQARVNYKIVNTKYLNQLALLTDLLDADNIYQETRYKLIEAETEARAIYYRLLYLSGNL